MSNDILLFEWVHARIERIFARPSASVIPCSPLILISGGFPKMNRWLFSLLALLLAASASLAADNYQIVLERDVKVTMRDGIVLKADIYRPKADGKFPVLLVRTPYDRRNEAGMGARRA